MFSDIYGRYVFSRYQLGNLCLRDLGGLGMCEEGLSPHFLKFPKSCTCTKEYVDMSAQERNSLCCSLVHSRCNVLSTLLRWFVHMRRKQEISILLRFKVCNMRRKLGRYVQARKQQVVMLSGLFSLWTW